MKRKLLVVVIFVVIFLAGIFIYEFISDRKNASGKIKILSSPTASVFIDAVAVGKTPYENNNMKLGTFEVKLIPDGEDKNTVTWQDKVQIYKNTLTFISRELGTSDLTSAGEVLTVVPMKKNPKGNTGEVYIETEPTGSIVYLDNDEKGIASIVLQDVPEGDHELAVYLPGFFRRSQKIEVEKGFQVRAKLKLALDQSHKTLEEELEEKKKQATEEAKKAEEKTAADSEDSGKNASGEAKTGTKIEVLDNEVGYLNVRSEPSVDGDAVTKVNPGETYVYIDEQNGWYKITLVNGSVGWVSGDYVSVF